MRKVNVIKSMLILLLVVVLAGSESMECFASVSLDSAQISTEERHIEQVSSSVEFGDGYVIEREELLSSGKTIIVERTSCEDNSSVLRIKQDGEWYVDQTTIDYQQLIFNLRFGGESLKEKSARRLEERYVTSFKTREYFGPTTVTETALYAVINACIGVKYNLSASIVSSIVTGLISGANTSTIEGYMDVSRHFYGVYDSTGSFLGYYNVAYSIYTYAKKQGKYVLMDTRAGKYQSLSVG